jgi:hypothetical protein
MKEPHLPEYRHFLYIHALLITVKESRIREPGCPGRHANRRESQHADITV